MAEAEATAQPPAPAPEAPKDAKERFTVKRQCRHCGETKPVAHEQWCQKNPNRRTKVVLPKKGEKAPAAPAVAKKGRDYKAEHERRKAKAAAKAPEAPAKPAAKTQEAFLAERKAELKGTPAKPGEKQPDDPAPAPAGDKKPAGMKTWLVLGLAGAGALLFLWALAQDAPQGEQPRNRGQRQAQDAELKPNGLIPGVGPVHVPGLG